jgi:hypothetical protein
MGVAIIKYPFANVNGHKSKWLPAHQPITLRMQRIDGEIINVKYIFNNGVPTQIIAQVSWLNIIKEGVKNGDRIRIFNGNNSKLFTISNVTINTITIDYSNIVTFKSKFVFVDVNYYIETKVYYITTIPSYNEIGIVKSKTDTFGIAEVSIQELLATKTINQNNFKYNKINAGLYGEGSRFIVGVRETYNGNTSNYSDLNELNVYYYTNSANQIQNTYGYNMGEYVPTLDATRTDKAKFQSVFKRPTYFPGYPFSLNFIYSDNMLNYQLIRNEETKDINGNVINNTTANLNITQRELANRLMLDGNYTTNIKTLDVWLETGLIIIDQTVVDLDYIASGYYAYTPPNNNYNE